MKGVPLNEELYNYIVATFVEEDDVLKDVVEQANRKGFPLIQVSPENGKFLHMLVRMIKARNVLEIGTLTGYSAIWMARALPEDGKLVTLEISKEHSESAIENFVKAGLGNKIELICGDALEYLETIKNSMFDFVFIDADKERYPVYLDRVAGIVNKGGLLCADNTLRNGEITSTQPDRGTEGVQIFNKMIARDPRFVSLLIPISDGLTVGLVR